MTHAIMEDLAILDKINKKEEDKEKRRQKQITEIKHQAETDELVKDLERLGAKEIKL